MENNRKVKDLLDRVYDLWESKLPGREGETGRFPGSEAVIRQSLDLLEETEQYYISDTELLRRREDYREILRKAEQKGFEKEDTGLLDGADDDLPADYLPGADKAKRRRQEEKNKTTFGDQILGLFQNLSFDLSVRGIWDAIRFFVKRTKLGKLIFAAAVIYFFWHYISEKTYHIPPFSSADSLYITNTEAYMLSRPYWDLPDFDTVQNKLPIAANTRLTPLATAEGDFLWAESPEGIRGFVHVSFLVSADRVENTKDTRLYAQLSDTKYRRMPPREFKMLKTVSNKEHGYITQYVQIQDSAGRIFYAKPNDLDYTALKELPHLNAKFEIHTTLEKFKENLNGADLDILEAHYGPAQSIVPSDSMISAVFRHLKVSSDGYVFKQPTVLLDTNLQVTGLQLPKNNQKPLISSFPLAERVRSRELARRYMADFYKENESEISVLPSWRNKGGYCETGVIILNVVLKWLLVWLFFSLPHFMVFLLLLPLQWLLKNPHWLLHVYTLLLAVAFYILFLIVVLETESIIWPAVFSVFAFGWWRAKSGRWGF